MDMKFPTPRIPSIPSSRTWLSSTGLLAMLLIHGPGWANEFDVQKDGDLISLTANNASLIAVADRLAEVTGITITYTEGKDSIVSIEIVDEPITQVVEKLSGSSMIIRKTIDGEEVIAEIVMLLEDEGGSAVSQSLPSGEPAEGVVVGGGLATDPPPPPNPEQQPLDPNIPLNDASSSEPQEILEDGSVIDANGNIIQPPAQ